MFEVELFACLFMSQRKPDTSFVFPEKQEVVSVYLRIYCKQMVTLLATKELLLGILTHSVA